MFALAVRSYYSLMRACSSPEKICAQAKELGYEGVAFTDLNSFSGMWDFLAACKKYTLHPLIGAEVSDLHKASSLYCLVRNPTGYANLCKLITKRKTHRNFSLLQESAKLASGLTFLSSSLSDLQVLHKNGRIIAANLGNRPTEQGSTLRRWAKQNSIPAVATTGAVMATEQEQELYQLLRAIATNSNFVPTVSGKNKTVCWLDSPENMREHFSVWPEVLPATDQLARTCTFREPQSSLIMPPWEKAVAGAAATLREAAYTGACKRYGNDLSEAVVERLQYELKVIDAMGFSSYFLVVRDIIHYDSKDSNKPDRRICGRGSGAASLVAYCLAITNVCPLKHDLYFERFLNPGRSDAPDIDVDFAWDERDAILDRVLTEYKQHAAMVCSIIRFQPRMAIRETAKAFGLPAGEIKQFCRLQRSPKGTQNMTAPWPQIIDFASQLINIPRHISVHPGGVVITPDPISEHVPVEFAAKGVPVIQWDKDNAEKGGLVKIDLLGNRSLGVIRDAIAAIEQSGSSFEEEYWQPEEDAQTQAAIANGKTMGCFYIESPAMRLLQQKAKRGDFEQLVLQSSIIRPAANEFIREYVRRLHGGSWQHLHPKLKDVLDETYGIMVYQEDVARVAVALAGFSHAEADGLRKVISKKDKILRLRDYRLQFERGCQQNGIKKEIREQVWQMMMSFDGYSFCKAHSASYAKVSYQAAYLKTHHPAEFMAAVISNQGGFYSTFAYVSEIKRMGLQLLAPCVNRSQISWQGKGKEIRIGFFSIKGLSAATMERIIQKREHKYYTSTLDFLQRVHPHRDESRALIQAGAMDGVSQGKKKGELFWELAQFHCLAKLQQTSSLFAMHLPPVPDLQPDTPVDALRQEYQALGFLCNAHPLQLIHIHTKGMTRAHTISGKAGKHITFAGWLITGKLVSTKTGEVMKFLTFEDETGIVETVFFPKVYRRYAGILTTGNAYILQGMVEEEFGVETLTVERVEKITARPAT